MNCKIYAVTLIGNISSFILSWDEKNGAQHEEMSIPATSMALHTHSGTSPFGNYMIQTRRCKKIKVSGYKLDWGSNKAVDILK